MWRQQKDGCFCLFNTPLERGAKLLLTGYKGRFVVDKRPRVHQENDTILQTNIETEHGPFD